MNIQYFESAEKMGQRATDLVLQEVRQKPDALLCAATGSSPKKLYQNLARHKEIFEKARIIPLDEWIGLPTPEGSCHTYIKEHVLNPLQIAEERYFGIDANAQHLEKECEHIRKLLNREGPIDVCVLGLGKNGHLGFNEPADELESHCHVANLAPQSQDHSMIGETSVKPTKGLTLGMNDILTSKKIILLISGKGKADATKQLLSETITNDCPATWLWKHNNVDCLILK